MTVGVADLVLSMCCVSNLHSLTLTYYLSHCVTQDGFTGLMGASRSGHTDVVQLLLSSGSKVDLQNKVRHSVNL